MSTVLFPTLYDVVMGERNETLRDFLIRVMRERDWRQADLARALPVDPSQVTRWVNGKGFPSRDMAIRLAHMFDYHPSYVLRLAGHDVMISAEVDLSDPLTSFAAANHDRLTVEQKRLLIGMAKQFMNEGERP